VQSMRITPSLVAVIVVVALALVFVLKFWGQGGILPPHEFAYGTALRNSDAIPERMDQFLSLEDLDANQVQIQIFVGNSSAKNLSPLIGYISSQRDHDFGALVAALKAVDQLSDQKEKAIRLVKTLLPYKEALKNDAQRDSIIIFVYYALKEPSQLSPEAKGKINSLVRQFDTAAQADKFDSGECPTNYLRGNINIYPLGLDNTSWHDTVGFDSPKDAPVLEIRFMGLKGIFRYLLDEMTAKTRAAFVHVDGESL
jgi:hypothetical protein